jgi:hypothetical protein
MAWSALLNNNNGPGTALTNTTVETDVTALPPFIIGQNMPLLSANEVLTIIAGGTVATSGSTPTLVLGAYYGSTGSTGGTALVATAATALTNQAAATWPWRLEVRLMALTLGTTGTIQARAVLYWPTSISAWTVSPLPITNVASVTVDTTSAKALTIGGTWGTAASTNILQLQYFDVTVCN